MVTNAGLPMALVLAASLNSFTCSSSSPSVLRSLARVWEKLNRPLLSTSADPSRVPALKSLLSILLPEALQ